MQHNAHAGSRIACDGPQLSKIADRLRVNEVACGRRHALWEGNNDAAGYYVCTFIPHGTAGNSNALPDKGDGNVDVKAFLTRLQDLRAGDGRYSNALYLQVVEGGFEVTGHPVTGFAGLLTAPPAEDCRTPRPG